jgi:hypothetical protein
MLFDTASRGKRMLIKVCIDLSKLPSLELFSKFIELLEELDVLGGGGPPVAGENEGDDQEAAD